MEDFGDQNDAVLAMWENVKIGNIPISITIALVAVILTIFAYMNVKKYLKQAQRRKRKKELNS